MNTRCLPWLIHGFINGDMRILIPVMLRVRYSWHTWNIIKTLRYPGGLWWHGEIIYICNMYIWHDAEVVRRWHFPFLQWFVEMCVSYLLQDHCTHVILCVWMHMGKTILLVIAIEWAMNHLFCPKLEDAFKWQFLNFQPPTKSDGSFSIQTGVMGWNGDKRRRDG